MRYISFDGVRSDTLGIRVDDMVPGGIAAGDLQLIDRIAGRAGYVTTGLGAAGAAKVSAKLFAPTGEIYGALKAWLKPGRSGRLILGDDAGHGYDAVLVSAQNVKLYTAKTYEVMVTWQVQPWRVVLPEAAAADHTTSGDTIANAYSMEARPVLTVVGTGDITLALAGHSIDIEDLAASIRIDTEAGTASTPDLATNLMDTVTGDVQALTIPPGGGKLTWSGTGSVTKVTLEPRYRDW